MNELIRYDAVCRAMVEAKTVDEVKGLRDKALAMQAYARQAKNKNLEIDAAEIRMRAERRLGELLKTMTKNPCVKTQGGGEGAGGSMLEPPAIPTLADIGIDKKLSSRAQQIADLQEDEFEERVCAWRDRAVHDHEWVTSNVLRYQHVSDESYEWYTPTPYLEAARHVMGSIDLDPASCEEAQTRVKAATYYTHDHDGLKQLWRGNVWLNPPYCMPDIQRFTEKMMASFDAGLIPQAIILVNNATDTAWFQQLLQRRGVVCFTRGRIHFYSPGGAQKLQTRQGQAIFYFGQHAKAFAKVFSEFGTVVGTYDHS